MVYDPIPDVLDALERYIDAKLLEFNDAAELRETRAKATAVRRETLGKALRWALQNQARTSSSTLPSSASSMRLEAIRPDKDDEGERKK